MIYSQEKRKKPLIHYVNGLTFKPKRKDSNMRLVDSISVVPYKFSIGDRIRLKGNTILLSDSVAVINTLKSHYYDCGGLIRKGLALVAKDGMYADSPDCGVPGSEVEQDNIQEPSAEGYQGE